MNSEQYSRKLGICHNTIVYSMLYLALIYHVLHIKNKIHKNAVTLDKFGVSASKMHKSINQLIFSQ